MLFFLIVIIFEKDGFFFIINGLNVIGLYLGILFIFFFMEGLFCRYGYKLIIVVGGFLVIVFLVLFFFWKFVVFWFVFCLFIGIGDYVLYFGI